MAAEKEIRLADHADLTAGVLVIGGGSGWRTSSPTSCFRCCARGIDPFKDQFPVTLRGEGTIRGTVCRELNDIDKSMLRTGEGRYAPLACCPR